MFLEPSAKPIRRRESKKLWAGLFRHKIDIEPTKNTVASHHQPSNNGAKPVRPKTKLHYIGNQLPTSVSEATTILSLRSRRLSTASGSTSATTETTFEILPDAPQFLFRQRYDYEKRHIAIWYFGYGYIPQ